MTVVEQFGEVKIRSHNLKSGELLAGASQAKINRTDKQLSPLSLTEDLKQIYAFADGESEGGLFKPGMTYRPLTDAVSMHEIYKEAREDDDGYLVEIGDFFPIFSTRTKVDVGVFLGSSAWADGSVYAVSFELMKVLRLAGSLGAYLAALNSCWESGVYKGGKASTSDPFEYLAAEVEIFRKVCGKDVYPVLKKQGKTYFSTFGDS